MFDPTPEQIEAAAEALAESQEGAGRWAQWDESFREMSGLRGDARAALVAAAGAAPREAKREDMIAAIAGGTITVPGGYGELQRDDAENIIDALMPTLAAPMQVDEAFEKWHAGWWQNALNVIAKANAQAAFHAGWLRGGGQ